MPSEPSNVNFEACILGLPSSSLALTLSWNYGNGSTLQHTRSYKSSHVYNRAGLYYVTLSIIKDLTGENLTSALEVIIPDFPVAQFTILSLSKLIVVFDASLSSSGTNGPQSAVVQYLWDFGDNTITQETTNQSISHTFSIGGTYLLGLTVTNNLNLHDTFRKSVQVGAGSTVNYTLYQPVLV